MACNNFFLISVNYCLLFIFILSIESLGDQHISSNGLNLSEKRAETLAPTAIAADDETESPPTSSHQRISDAIRTYQNRTDRTQQLHLEKKSAQIIGPLVGKNGQHLDTAKRQSQKFRSLFSWISKFHQNLHIVRLYQKLKNMPGGWGKLIKKMYGEMILAKKHGTGDSEPLRGNCQRALRLIGEGRGGVKRIDVKTIEPYRDFWTLLKHSAQSLAALFKGTSKARKGREIGGKGRTENILRTLKTFSEADNPFFLRMVRKNKKTDEGQRRRQKRLISLVIFGIIIGGLMVIAFLSEWLRAF